MDVLVIGQIIEAMNTEGMTTFVYDGFLVSICRLSSTETHIMKKRSSHDCFIFINHIPNINSLYTYNTGHERFIFMIDWDPYSWI